MHASSLVKMKPSDGSISLLRSALFFISLSRLLIPSRSADNPVVTKKPNIVLILADDVGQGDLPVYFNTSAVSMPNIDALVSNSVLFTDVHSTPLCAPSRYMLLSGMYQHRGRSAKGTWSLAENKSQFKGKQKSIAEVLKDGGNYNTMMAGKWHIGAKIPPTGVQDKERLLSSPFHDWSLQLIDGPQEVGFDHSYITAEGIQRAPYAFFRDGHLDISGTDVKNWDEGDYPMQHGMSTILHEGEGSIDWDSTAYNMILVNETEAFIDGHLSQRPNDPFFAYVALGAVHQPHSPPDVYLDGSRVKGEYPSSHLDMLHEVDKVVGSLVHILESRNLTEDTIIIFTSDNGGLNEGRSDHLSSGPLRGHKGNVYEGGHRIPFIIRHDGKFPAGEKRHHLLGLNDVFATLCELAQVPVPKGSAKDSISFADYITSGEPNDARRDTYGIWKFNKRDFLAAALRKNEWKVIQDHSLQTVELYDLSNDLMEQDDLSNREEYSDLVAEMLLELTKMGPCPEDTTDFFNAVIDGEDKELRCRWFSVTRKKRCKMIHRKLARNKCPRTCGRYYKMCSRLPLY